MRGNKDYELVAQVAKLVSRQLEAGRDPRDIHMDLQRAYIEAGGAVGVEYPMHRSGKPRLPWQQHPAQN